MKCCAWSPPTPTSPSTRSDLPPPDECVDAYGGLRLPGVTLSDRVDVRAPKPFGWAKGRPTGIPCAEFWLRFADGRPADTASLATLVDTVAPAVLELGVTESSTAELTVHVRARPVADGTASAWLAVRAATRHLAGGYYEEDVELWDEDGGDASEYPWLRRAPDSLLRSQLTPQRRFATQQYDLDQVKALADQTGRIQLYCRRDVLGDDGFALLDLLDIGDVVGMAGPLFRTRTGEITVKVEEAQLLAKSLRPLPFGKEELVDRFGSHGIVLNHSLHSIRERGPEGKLLKTLQVSVSLDNFPPATKKAFGFI